MQKSGELEYLIGLNSRELTDAAGSSIYVDSLSVLHSEMQQI